MIYYFMYNVLRNSLTCNTNVKELERQKKIIMKYNESMKDFIREAPWSSGKRQGLTV
jgi:hypothetical protein